jgi:arylsulfatase A-like enzyme
MTLTATIAMPDRPNILLITSDQQHWRTLGCLNREISTPHLDRLASQGTLFSRAYCPNPTCTPTRASIITGQYPSQHGAWSLGTKLPEEAHTVGEDLQAAGYRTALIGKAHFQQLLGTEEFPSLEANQTPPGQPTMHDLDFWRGFHGPFYGFQHVELARNHTEEFHVGQHYAIWMEENGCANWRDYFMPPAGNNDSQRWKWLIPERYHYDPWIAERTNALMEEYRDQGAPFLLWASFLDPHPPYLAPEPWDTMYDLEALTLASVTPGEHDHNPPHFGLTQQRDPDFSPWRESGQWIHGMHSHLQDRARRARDAAVYYGMISLMDKYIGRILARLDELGLAESTVVIFTTDHGHFLGHHGLVAKGPFHYEDLVKLPFLVRWPGQVPAGVRSEALQSLVDLAPTFLGLAGIPTPRTMTGVDQSAVWRGESPSARDHVIVENRHEPTSIHVKTYVDQRYKLTVYYNHPYGELFDLQSDPGETNNLWADPAHAALKSDLLLKLLHAEMGKEPLWMPRVWGA